MPNRQGAKVAGELGNRFLVRYLRATQLNEFRRGSIGRKHWVTPTAYEPDETIPWLALSPTLLAPSYALLLDPNKIPIIKGPRYVRMGAGIEYVLPNGFPANAIAGLPWEVNVR